MKITQTNEANHKANDQLWQKKSGLRLLILVALSLFVGTISARAQVTVNLSQRVLEVKHTEYVDTGNPDTAEVTGVKSSNPRVARASVYRVISVQIVAVAPGKTTVEFWDNAAKILYIVPVWVTASNATGGGGQGFNPQLTQLDQIVMLVKRTQNVTVPGGGTARISGVKSSNPSVATARTNTATTIQIYSVALGDTFIEFTDNATGTTYQVHVYVRDTLSGPNGGSGAGGGGGGGGGGGSIDLPQIVMFKGHTQNVFTQNSGTSQIVNINSSNLSVATARGNTSKSIQIFARALGDTYITFFDAATRTTYKVHVWVIKPGDPSPQPAAGPNPGPKPKPNPNPKPHPKPNPQPGPSGDFDRCLVGTWRSEPGGTGLYSNGGLIFSVKPDANAAFIYDGLKPWISLNPYGGGNETFTTTLSGKATAQINDNRNHVIEAANGVTSSVTQKVTGPDGTTTGRKPGGFLPDGAQVVHYTCSADTLILKFTRDMTFKKVE